MYLLPFPLDSDSKQLVRALQPRHPSRSIVEELLQHGNNHRQQVDIVSVVETPATLQQQPLETVEESVGVIAKMLFEGPLMLDMGNGLRFTGLSKNSCNSATRTMCWDKYQWVLSNHTSTLIQAATAAAVGERCQQAPNTPSLHFT